MKIKIYEKYPDGFYEYNDDYSKDSQNVEVVSVTETNDNYVVILNKDNYFGKTVFVYDKNRFLIMIGELVEYPSFIPNINILSKNEIAIFNSYIENNDMPIAFGNSDWNKIYSKIVGDQRSSKIREWQNRYRDE